MCRLVAYLGVKVMLERVLVKPQNSLVMQSLNAQETTIHTNGDGFGLGWYAPEINERPALFSSIFPAWNDRNLLHLTSKIISPCFFAHVRAASVGGINPLNCHPFNHGKWLLMHNGEIANFMMVKRHLRRMLDDEFYHWIQGETDSEHIFALFLQLAKGKDLSDFSVVTSTFEDTIAEINYLVSIYGSSEPSYLNVCLTDGQRMIACRYCSDKQTEPLSLHYFAGCSTEEKANYQAQQSNQKTDFVLISSEKLSDFDEGWEVVPTNHLVLIDKDLSIQTKAIG